MNIYTYIFMYMYIYIIFIFQKASAGSLAHPCPETVADLRSRGFVEHLPCKRICKQLFGTIDHQFNSHSKFESEWHLVAAG